MSASIRSSADGSQAILAVNGADKLTVNSDGTVVASASPANGDNTKKLATTEFLQASMLGSVGQTIVDVTASRAIGVTYYNTTGRPIVVYLILSNPNNMPHIVNGVTLLQDAVAYGYGMASMFIVPAGGSYSLGAGSGGAISSWKEMR